jgi:hypothetical protein
MGGPFKNGSKVAYGGGVQGGPRSHPGNWRLHLVHAHCAYIWYTRTASTSSTRTRRLHLIHAHSVYISHTPWCVTLGRKKDAVEQQRCVARGPDPVLAAHAHLPPRRLSSAHLPPRCLSSAPLPPRRLSSAHLPPRRLSSAPLPPRRLSSAPLPPRRLSSAPPAKERVLTRRCRLLLAQPSTRVAYI